MSGISVMELMLPEIQATKKERRVFFRSGAVKQLGVRLLLSILDAGIDGGLGSDRRL